MSNRGFKGLFLCQVSGDGWKGGRGKEPQTSSVSATCNGVTLHILPHDRWDVGWAPLPAYDLR